jgi:hypothetical protein
VLPNGNSAMKVQRTTSPDSRIARNPAERLSPSQAAVLLRRFGAA